MTPDPPPSLAPAVGSSPPAGRRATVKRYAGFAVRIAFVGMILAAGYALMDLYRTLFTDPPAGESIPDSAPPPDPVSGPQDAVLADGAWTVGDAGWATKLSQVAPEELEMRLQAAGEPLPTGRAEADIERDLLWWVRENGRAEPSVAGCSVYRVSVNSAHVRVVTEVSGGRERVRLGQIVFAGSPGTVSLLEITPAPAGDRTAASLLPLPAGVEVQARRWSGDRVAAELVGPWPENQPLPAEWAAAGWVGRPIGTGDGHGFEYRKGGATVQVWRFGVPGGTGSLLLVRGR